MISGNFINAVILSESVPLYDLCISISNQSQCGFQHLRITNLITLVLGSYFICLINGEMVAEEVGFLRPLI